MGFRYSSSHVSYSLRACTTNNGRTTNELLKKGKEKEKERERDGPTMTLINRSEVS